MEESELDLMRRRLEEMIATWAEVALECRENANEYEAKVGRTSIYWNSCAETLGGAISQVRNVLAGRDPKNRG